MNKEKITKEFFKRRFPDKNIDFEKECGYFYEWVKRFESNKPENYMDNISLRIWKEMQKEKKQNENNKRRKST